MAVSQDRGGDQIVLKKLSREAIRQSVQLIPQEFLHAGLNRTVRLFRAPEPDVYSPILR
jgi:hypothetical protein